MKLLNDTGLTSSESKNLIVIAHCYAFQHSWIFPDLAWQKTDIAPLCVIFRIFWNDINKSKLHSQIARRLIRGMLAAIPESCIVPFYICNMYELNVQYYCVVWGAGGGAVGWGCARFPVVSLEFFIGIVLPATLWPWGWLSLLTEMSTRNISCW
jgi:hypothetical protein